MKKVGIISQARMTSTRLPGKILKQINGKSLLEYHIERLQQSEYPIHLATTTNATDDVVAAFAREHSISCFRGSEDNVLSRYYGCALEHALDVVVRVTSDCPLIDGVLLKSAIERYVELDDAQVYLSNALKRSFPRGFDFEIFSFASLEEAYKNATTVPDLEHVTPYINQNKSGKIRLEHVVHTEDQSGIRITVDTPEDFALIETLILDHHADKMNYKEIIEVFKKHPELISINAHIEQKKL